MILVLLAIVLLLQPARVPTPQEWEAAERAIVRLEPAAFTDLPASVRDDLDRRRCTIPQSDPGTAPHGVIRGRFTSAGRTDIAVLCSVDGASTILVFRGASAADVAQLARSADKDFLQGAGGGRIQFSRVIGVAAPARIREYHKAFGGPALPRLDHDGIEDIFAGKASVIRYWAGGKWLELPGAD